MRTPLLPLIVISLAIAFQAAAEPAPPVIAAGMNAYKESGPQGAIKTWLEGSALEGSKEAMSQANMLNQVHDFYGAYQSYEIIQTHAIGASSQMIYLALNCERGAVFAKFLAFKRGTKWVVSSFKFHTSPEEALPAELLVD